VWKQHWVGWRWNLKTRFYHLVWSSDFRIPKLEATELGLYLNWDKIGNHIIKGN
jgi:hypothetical protein